MSRFQVRYQAIVSLRKMEVNEVLPILIKNFSKERRRIKIEILKTIQSLRIREGIKCHTPVYKSTGPGIKNTVSKECPVF